MELRVYTMDEAVKALKLSRYTLMNYMKAGKLKGAKIGRDWRFTEEQLKDFLKSMTPDDLSGELPGEQDVCDK
jgi:excisionase family DNA binding protein